MPIQLIDPYGELIEISAGGYSVSGYGLYGGITWTSGGSGYGNLGFSFPWPMYVGALFVDYQFAYTDGATYSWKFYINDVYTGAGGTGTDGEYSHTFTVNNYVKNFYVYTGDVVCHGGSVEIDMYTSTTANGFPYQQSNIKVKSTSGTYNLGVSPTQTGDTMRAYDGSHGVVALHPISTSDAHASPLRVRVRGKTYSISKYIP